MSECINFDLERMKAAVNSPSVRVPKGLSEDEFIEWIKSEAIMAKENNKG